MKCSSSEPWTEIKPGLWVRTDSDGYTLRVRQREAGWRWSVQPPGGGYDLFFGTDHELAEAIENADSSLRGLYDEIRPSRKGPGGRR